MNAPRLPPASVDSAGTRIARVIPWFVAVVFAVVAGALLVRQTRDRRELEDLRTERDLAQTAYQMMSNQLDERTLLAERLITDFGRRLQRQEDLTRLRVIRLAATSPEYETVHAVVVWDPATSAGLLTAEQLPTLAPGRQYRIGVVHAGDNLPASVAPFTPAPDGRATTAFKVERAGTAISAFVISVTGSAGAPGSDATVIMRGG